MGYAVEMFFDEATEAQIREIWEALAQAGLGDDLGALGFRPHISLGLCEDLDEKVFRPLLDAFAERYLPMETAMPAVGLFPGDVLYLAPVVDDPLLKMHTEFCKLFRRYAEDPNPMYLIGQWVAHCSLTMNLRPDERGGAVSIALSAALPIRGQYTEIGLSTFLPAASRYRFLLS